VAPNDRFERFTVFKPPALPERSDSGYLLALGRILRYKRFILLRFPAPPVSAWGQAPPPRTGDGWIPMRRLPILFLISCLASSLSARDFRFFQPLQPPRGFQVMVHRGAAAQAPENTRPAIERMIEDDFEWVEVDVRRSSDGKHVLYHDSRLDGKTSGKGLLKDLSLEAILRLDAGSWFASRFAGEPLLALNECLLLTRGRVNLYLDCKDADPGLLVREILAARMEGQVVVFDRLEQLRKVRSLSQGRIAIMPKWHPPLGTAAWLEALDPEAVEVDADELTADIARAFHQKRVKVQVKVLGNDWDRPEMWERMLASGADWFQTGLPEELVAQLVWKKMEKHPVRISLHRGASRYMPENTLPAFEKAIRMGADFIEFDARAASDGCCFLLHDGELQRTTNGAGAIAATASAAVAELDAGSWFGRPYSGTAVPALDSFLAAVRGRIGLYLDAKSIDPEALAAALEKYGVADRTVVYGDTVFLAKLKAARPSIRRMPRLGDLQALDELARLIEPYAFDARWEILSPELVRRCHERGILVFSDALGRHERVEDYLQAMRCGVDLIQTDHPMRLIRAVEIQSRGVPPQ
jgi:glycerophosphoryl diester phosphodiesterase